jgi:hypothetical protein
MDGAFSLYGRGFTVKQERREILDGETLAQEFRAAYGQLGADREEADVELFLAAQREVVMRDAALQSIPSGQSMDEGSTASPRDAET